MFPIIGKDIESLSPTKSGGNVSLKMEMVCNEFTILSSNRQGGTFMLDRSAAHIGQWIGM